MLNFITMNTTNNSFSNRITTNIIKILKDRNLTQSSLAKMLDTTESQISKKLKGDVKLTLDEVSKIATGLSIREIDIITYPEKYEQIGTLPSEPVEAILQIRLAREKKDQVLKLVFGENNIEILNK